MENIQNAQTTLQHPLLSHCFKHALAPITSALRHARIGLTIFPVPLNTRSASALIAGMLSSSSANLAR
jgi:hypothetical protein